MDFSDTPEKMSLAGRKATLTDQLRPLLPFFVLFGPCFSLAERTRTSDLPTILLGAGVVGLLQTAIFLVFFRKLFGKAENAARFRFVALMWLTLALCNLLSVGISRGIDTAYVGITGNPVPGQSKRS